MEWELKIELESSQPVVVIGPQNLEAEVKNSWGALYCYW